ncbi:hypothetical protein AB0C70_38100 [Streptomyces sp. NPDC048564]|uniref:hypothetical protein n=1 Tax=Streptomyces sp. NPDC048564 TaxID=3155760 RepID=UPI0034456DF1
MRTSTVCPSPGTDRPGAAHRRTAVRGGRSRTTLADQRTLPAWFRTAPAPPAASIAVVRLTHITRRALRLCGGPTAVHTDTPAARDTPRPPARAPLSSMVRAGQHCEKAAMIYRLPMTGDGRKLLPVST